MFFKRNIQLVFFSIIMVIASLIPIFLMCFAVRLTSLGQNTYYVRYNQFGLSEVIVILLIILFSVIHFSYLRRNNRFKHVFQQLLWAYLLRCFIIVLDLYFREYIHLPNSGADSEHFYGIAKIIATGRDVNYMLFTTMMGKFYEIFGVSRLLSQFLLMLCSMVTLYNIVLVLNKLNVSVQSQRKTILIVGLLPNFAILSSVFLRESIVTMLISFSLVFTMNWVIGKRDLHFYLGLLPAFFAAAFHSGAIAVFSGMIFVRFFYDKTLGKFHFSAKNILPALFAVILSAYICQRYSDTIMSKVDKIESIEDISDNIERGDSSYAKYVGGSSGGISSIAVYSLPRMFYFSFSPLPWQWRGIPDIIAFCFSSMFYLYTLREIFKYFMKNKIYDYKQHIAILTLILVSLSCTFVFSWGTNNTGTATRHRDKMMGFSAVLFALAISQKSKYRKMSS